MTLDQHGPLTPWATHVLQWRGTKGLPNRKMELIPENPPQFGLEAATRLHEAGITSNRESAMSR